MDTRHDKLRHQFAILTARLEDLQITATAGQAVYKDRKTYGRLVRRLERALQQLTVRAAKIADHAAQK